MESHQTGNRGGFSLHHVGHLVGDLATAAESWASRFGYVVESEPIEDATQAAWVQFLRQPGAPYWVELITPNGPESRLRNAMARGQGLHHVCYEVPELEAAGRHLRERGMFPLGRPVQARAFGGRRIAWFIDRAGLLVELLEAGNGPFNLASLATSRP